MSATLENQSESLVSPTNESKLSDCNSGVDSASKPVESPPKIDLVDQSSACGEILSKNIDEQPANSEFGADVSSEKARCDSTLPISKLEGRHFIKTRSFSAVEETPDKKIIADRLGVIPDFPVRDVAHSRSEQLETHSLLRHDISERDDPNLIASSSTVVDYSDISRKDRVANDSQTPSSGGDTLIMQFDYFSNDQPMSLQNDPRLTDSPGQTISGQYRKSGRDLTELGTEVARNSFDKLKTNRILSSRPRLELHEHIHLMHPPYCKPSVLILL